MSGITLVFAVYGSRMVFGVLVKVEEILKISWSPLLDRNLMINTRFAGHYNYIYFLPGVFGDVINEMRETYIKIHFEFSSF